MVGGAASAWAQPLLSVPITSNLGAEQVTLEFQASTAGTGYFTLLEGGGVAPGDGAQTKAGQDANGAAAARFGSLRLAANTAGCYTVRSLKAATTYTVCFTADDGASLQGTAVQRTFTTPAAIDLSGRDWAEVRSSNFSDGSAYFVRSAFSPEGRLHVAFSDGSRGGKLTVLMFDGVRWTPVGAVGFSSGCAEYVNLVFAPDGAPCVAFSDYGNDYRATVMRFDGAAWGPVGSGVVSGGRAPYPSLAFAPDGTPYLAFCDWDKAMVMKYDGSRWITVGNARFSEGDVESLSLAFAPDGVPYVAFGDGNAYYRATVMKCNGPTWTVVGSAGFSRLGGLQSTSLDFAPDGTLYLAFGYGFAPATVMKLAGTEWTAVGNMEFSAAEAFDVNLAISSIGTPYVAYMDRGNGNKATVMQYTGAVWSEVGRAGFSADMVSYTNLAFSPNGALYISYQDRSTDDYQATVMELRPPPPTTYEEWAAANFTEAEQGNAALSGASADPDGAGVINLMRYALDLPARGPVGDPNSWTIATAIADGQRYAELHFNRRSLAPGLKYEVEASTDLVNWAVLATSYSGTPATVKARDSVVFGTVPRRFLRLRVTLP